MQTKLKMVIIKLIFKRPYLLECVPASATPAWRFSSLLLLRPSGAWCCSVHLPARVAICLEQHIT